MEPVYYQNMTGLSDWWSAATNKVGSWFDSGAATASESYEAASNLVSTQSEALVQQLDDFRVKMNELVSKQNEVDRGIEAMDEGLDKERLKAKRDESRGIVDSYILPAWQKIASMMSWDQDPTTMSGMGYCHTGMGIVPIVAYAGAAAAAAISASIFAYVVQQIRVQNEILADPALKAKFLSSQATSSGVFESVANIFSSSKTIVLVAGAAGLIGYFLLMKKK